MSSVCEGCKGEIAEGEVLKAFGMCWHPYHLCCKVCQRDFGDGGKCCEGSDGFAYCEACHQETFTPTCVMCCQPIENELKVEALGKMYHQRCFKCPCCDKPFDGLSFMPGEDGNVYCERHYYEKLGMLCAVCDMPITDGKRIRVDERAYHVDHFTCEGCKKHLAGLTYKKKNTHVYWQVLVPLSHTLSLSVCGYQKDAEH